MKIDRILVRNTLTGEEGTIRSDWFRNPAINPDGLLEEIEHLSGGCVGCGTEAPAVAEPDTDEIEDPDFDEEEDD